MKCVVLWFGVFRVGDRVVFVVLCFGFVGVLYVFCVHGGFCDVIGSLGYGVGL